MATEKPTPSVFKVNGSSVTDLKTVYLSSPIGLLEIRASAVGLRAVSFVDEPKFAEELNEYNSLTINQLEQYFDGKLKSFDIPFDLEGTDFQKNVWHKLLEIPFGKTVAYNDIARALGDLKAIRAVGTANGANKIAIIIPCHRAAKQNGEHIERNRA